MGIIFLIAVLNVKLMKRLKISYIFLILLFFFNSKTLINLGNLVFIYLVYVRESVKNYPHFMPQLTLVFKLDAFFPANVGFCVT